MSSDTRKIYWNPGDSVLKWPQTWGATANVPCLWNFAQHAQYHWWAPYERYTWLISHKWHGDMTQRFSTKKSLNLFVTQSCPKLILPSTSTQCSNVSYIHVLQGSNCILPKQNSARVFPLGLCHEKAMFPVFSELQSRLTKIEAYEYEILITGSCEFADWTLSLSLPQPALNPSPIRKRPARRQNCRTA